MAYTVDGWRNQQVQADVDEGAVRLQVTDSTKMVTSTIHMDAEDAEVLAAALSVLIKKLRKNR